MAKLMSMKKIIIGFLLIGVILLSGCLNKLSVSYCTHVCIKHYQDDSQWSRDTCREECYLTEYYDGKEGLKVLIEKFEN